MLSKVQLHTTIFLSIVLFVCMGSTLHSQKRTLDDFEDVSGWQAIPSDGVALTISNDAGLHGKCLRVDFEFQAASGYAVARKLLPIELPEDYQFRFFMKAAAPANNFEFKLADSAANVYWINWRNYTYPADWKSIVIKKRHITFAWGPAGGGTIRKVSAVEFVVTAGTGGKGTVWIDDFALEPRGKFNGSISKPAVQASSEQPGAKAAKAVDDNAGTAWQSSKGGQQWLTLDFGGQAEYGGLIIDWKGLSFAADYDILASNDGREWRRLYTVRNSNGGRDYINLTEGESKFIKLNFLRSGGNGYAINDLRVQPVEYSASINDFFKHRAADAPKGYYPKYLYGEQSYWTIVGTSGDFSEALINEEGTIEVDKSRFSLEPFMFLDDRLLTWNDASITQQLEDRYLPIPMVTRAHSGFELIVTAFSSGQAGASSLFVRYGLKNSRAETVEGLFFLAIRPFQALPPWQQLNISGGATHLRRIRRGGGTALVDENKAVIPLQKPDRFGAASFDEGDITEYLQSGAVPSKESVVDPFGYASGALGYHFRLAPGEIKELYFEVPFHGINSILSGQLAAYEDSIKKRIADTKSFWKSKLDRITMTLPRPAQKIEQTYKTSLAYILINRDGPAIQPGSRTYERAWIRDGSMTSAALLRTGNHEEVREYINWYARYQYPNGKIPCVVDHRGPDPVPEHDSHGQFIYAVMEYFRFTKDTSFLKTKFPHVVKAVEYIRSLRAERKTDEYRFGDPERRAMYGLVPESISHEGYSAKPMHSYWDDFFVMKGLKDAAEMARVLGEEKLAQSFARERDDFREALYRSIQLAMTNKKIDYIPGCVELGDFDAPSTAIGIYPCSELENIPQPALSRTFDKYFEFFQKRKANGIEWAEYTPYEVRLAGTFVYLDRKERAHELLGFLFHDQRPITWNHWAEVVWRDPAAPRFIGDMPHTWVASDYMNAVRSMFVYEKDHAAELVIGAGIPEEWLDDPVGVAVSNFPTYYGKLSFAMKQHGQDVKVELSVEDGAPGLQLTIKSPRTKPLRRVRADGQAISPFQNDQVRLQTIPHQVILTY